MNILPQDPPADPGAHFVVWEFTSPGGRRVSVTAAYDMREDEARRSPSAIAGDVSDTWTANRRVVL